MKLMTQEHLVQFRRAGRQEGNPDPTVVLKLFAPWNGWTWLVTEFDETEGIFFGLVIGQEREWGYFSLAELESVCGPYGLTIERDLYFTPCPISQVRI